MLQPLWVPLHKICLILLGLMSNICLAQELPLELASLDNSHKPTQHQSAPRVEIPDPDSAQRLAWIKDLDLRINLDTSYPGGNYWNDYGNQPSYHINYEYCGIQGVIYSQNEKIANRYYKQQLAVYWNQTYSHPFDLDKRMRSYQLESSNNGYHWWDRTWRESLPPEKGGQTTITHKIGSRIEILQIGPLGLTNEGRFSWESWRLDIEDNPETALSDIEAIQRTETLREKYNLGIKSPEALYRADWFDFKVAARVNVRVDNLTMENKSEIGLSFKFILKHQGISYLRVTGSIKCQPLTRQAEAQLQLSLLEF